MKLSVVIVNYNVRYYLEQCLLSVLSSLKDLETEVFVVDNNSSDGSLEYLQPKFPGVTFIANHDNPGFSKANNQAIRQSTGKYVLLLNPDTVVGEDTLQNVCRFMDDHPDAGGLGVKMIDGYGRFLPESKRGFPSPWNSFCKMTGISRIFPRSPLFGKYHLKYLEENKVHRVDVLAGAFMLLRREVLNKTGLLDETFFMYGEDIDLSYRITQAGYHNYYVPEKIIHYKGESTKKDFRYVQVFYEAMLIFFKKHYPHYSKFYGLFVQSGIYFAGSLSALKKMIFRKKTGDTGYPNPSINHKPALVFNTKKDTYKEIINQIDTKGTKMHFWIYHPDIEVAIAPDKILTGKNIEEYGLIGK